MMQRTDPWHYARADLAKQIMAIFQSGLASSFVFFAPRRMGKTEFLRKDIAPEAQAQGWNVFYFSFLDAADDPAEKFRQSLEKFMSEAGMLQRVKKTVKKIVKVSASIGKLQAGVELEPRGLSELVGIKELLETLTKKRKTLLLMDEVQVLALHEKNDVFVASLRTALDMYKDNLKTIFTGSSQAGLRKMFSQAKAPFFHFGQSLNFPELDRGFVDHLSGMFEKVTQRKISTQELWEAFVEMNKVPLFVRSLVERMALNPSLRISEAKNELKAEIAGNSEYQAQWSAFSPLEQMLLKTIASGVEHIFSLENRKQLALKLGRTEIFVSTLQAAIKKLTRKGLIAAAADRAQYVIEDLNLKIWLTHYPRQAASAG